MDFPSTIFLYVTNIAEEIVRKKLSTLPLASQCHIRSLLNDFPVKQELLTNSLLITDSDPSQMIMELFKEISPCIFSIQENFHTTFKEKFPLPVFGLLPEPLAETPMQTIPAFSGIPYVFEGISNVDDDNISFVFCRFHQLPVTILKTPRLTLREWGVKDSDAIFHLYQEFPKEDALPPIPTDSKERLEFLTSYIHGAYGFYGHGLWCVTETESQTTIGQCGIEYKERNGIDRYELQYMIAPSHQNAGFAFEICSAICQYAKEVLFVDELFAFIHPDNIRSIGLIKKLGFHFYKEESIDGTLVQIYSI